MGTEGHEPLTLQSGESFSPPFFYKSNENCEHKYDSIACNIAENPIFIACTDFTDNVVVPLSV